MPRSRNVLIVVTAFAGVLAAVDARAVTSSSSIPFAPFGDSSGGSAGATVPLTPTSFVVASIGPDRTAATADDSLLLVSAADTATPVIGAVTVPFLSSYSGRVARLSATRVLVTSAGPDGTWKSADDLVNVVDAEPGNFTSTPVTVGHLDARDGYVAEVLSSRVVAITSLGADDTESTADDQVLLLTDIGGTNTVTRLAAPFAALGGRGRPERLGPASFLVASNGPDGTKRTADDVVYLFTDAGGTNARADLAVPFLCERAPGRPVRVTATRALVSSCGLDATETSADDRLMLLDGLGTTNTVTPIPTGSLSNYAAGRAAPLSAEVAVVSTPGIDNGDITADDGYVIVRNLGTTRDVTTIPIGGLDEDNGARATRLSSSVFALTTAGPNLMFNGAVNGVDDTVAIVTLDAAGAGTMVPVTIPGVDAATASVVVALSADAFLVGGGGADGRLDAGLDDTITLVTAARTASPVVETIPVGSELGSSRASSVAQLLGGGRAVFVASGPDGKLNGGNPALTAGDDVLRVLSGLPDARGLSVTKVSLGFTVAKPAKGETVAVTGVLHLDEPALLTGSAVTITIGRASQTLPAGAFVAKKGGKFEYADKKGVHGFIRKISYATTGRSAGKLTISGKGLATGAERTTAAYIPVALDCDDVYLSALVAGTAGKKGITFKE